MKCPVCHEVRMREVEKNGVLIDVCPDCKGVWLDRGELDKLMKGVHELRSEFDHLQSDDDYRYGREGRDYDQRSSGRDHYPPKHRKRKKTVLDVFGDLFD